MRQEDWIMQAAFPLEMSLANAEVEIAYDPMNTETIKVLYQDMKPIMAHRVSIGAFCDGCLNAGLLDQMGLEARFYRGDSKRQLQKEIAHLLGKETLEEFRFLLNYRFDSASPMSLILVGQTELWDQKLRLQSYAAIRQRIDMNIVLNRLDRAETGKYIAAHMAYADVKQDLFTSGAEDEIFKVSAGIPRMINRICEKY
jgi:type II secretory pathway, component exeA (predicted ATPase)